MAAASARTVWAAASARDHLSRGARRIHRPRRVTPRILFVAMSIAACAAAAAAVEGEPAAASSMLRRRQLEDLATTATVAAAAAGPAAEKGAPMVWTDEVDLEGLNWWDEGQAAALEGGGDKGWFLGGGGQPSWPFCAWEGTLTRNISNIFAL